MSVYLHDIPLEQAWQHFNDALTKAGISGIHTSEQIPVDEHAVGRVLAEGVIANISSPHYHASAMDGFAVSTASMEGVSSSHPVDLKIPEEAIYVDTGDALPDWANAVVPIEDVEPLAAIGEVADDIRRPTVIRLRSPLAPWVNVRPMGEDIVASQLVLLAGHRIRPVDLGAAAACGTTHLTVVCQPQVGIIPTGSELIPIGSPIRAGEIIEFNSIVMAAQVKEWGAAAKRYAIVPDDEADLTRTIQRAADECDLVLVNAGSSAGSEDFTAGIVDSLGELLVHGIAVRPGHPVVLGMLRRSSASKCPDRLVPVVGVPGYPVSAALTMEIIVKPLIEAWLGLLPIPEPTIQAQLTRKIVSPAGDDDYVRVVLGRVGSKMLAAPLPRGAGVITSLTRADGLLVIPRGKQGLEAGASVTVSLKTPPSELDRTIFAIGSHDMTLDYLAQALAGQDRRLVSANVGSQGGLVALRRGEAHFAGSHLLDPETGKYNLAYLVRYLHGVPVRLIRWAERQQGFIVARGNPKKIYGLKDLERQDDRLGSRQRGSGTRVLLDYLLSKGKLAPDAISGYDQEEYTHLAVAVAVASGRADCGLGVAAAAFALGLEFIPVASESYELVIPMVYATSPLLEPIYRIMSDLNFRRSVGKIPGYDTNRMGTVTYEGTP